MIVLRYFIFIPNINRVLLSSISLFSHLFPFTPLQSNHMGEEEGDKWWWSVLIESSTVTEANVDR